MAGITCPCWHSMCERTCAASSCFTETRTPLGIVWNLGGALVALPAVVLAWNMLYGFLVSGLVGVLNFMDYWSCCYALGYCPLADGIGFAAKFYLLSNLGGALLDGRTKDGRTAEDAADRVGHRDRWMGHLRTVDLDGFGLAG
ncbi:hypothetical protein ACLOJK_007035 [Asimina triloba]